MILRRFIALLILAVLVCLGLAIFGVIHPVSWLPPAVATDLGLPTQIFPEIKPQIPTLYAAIQPPAASKEAPEVLLQGTPYVSPTPPPTLIPTPVPVRNGRIIFLGVDKWIYSTDTSGAVPIKLGLSGDFHLVVGTDWYSPDGRYALVLQTQDNASNLVVNSVDNSIPPVLLGEWDSSTTPAFQERFEFASDSSHLLFIANNDSGRTLELINLPDGSKTNLPLVGNDQALNQAAFYGDSRHVLVAQDDPAGGNPRLDVFEFTGADLQLVATLIAYPGFQLEQFKVSPGAKWVAVALKDASGESTLFLVDTAQPQAVPIVSGNSSILLLHPTWSPDGRYLLMNRWLNDQPPTFGLLVYDTQDRILTPIIDGQPASQVGSPVAIVASFAPDGKAIGFSVYDQQADRVAFWLAVLDGSYTRMIAESQKADGFPQGEFVAGIAPNWTQSVILASEPGSPLGSLFAAALDGTQRLLLDNFVPYRFFNLGPVLSPDGLRVAYLRLSAEIEPASAELDVVNLDGSNKQALVSGANSVETVPGIPLVWLPAFP